MFILAQNTKILASKNEPPMKIKLFLLNSFLTYIPIILEQFLYLWHNYPEKMYKYTLEYNKTIYGMEEYFV